MNILLIGEYNSSHYGLKIPLEKMGHKVTVIGHGDGFKHRKSDINYRIKYTSGLSYYLRRLIYSLSSIDITSLSIYSQINKLKHRLKDYDIVQLINETPFAATPDVEKKLLEYVFANNKNVFLLSCGTDYVSVKYAFDKKFRYSILTPYFEGRGTRKEFWHALKYLSKPYVDLHEFVYRNIKGVIASDFDYHLPLLDNEKYIGLAPNPIDLEKLTYSEPKVDGKIIIFHGINLNNYYKKGNDIFEEALEILKQTHSDKIEIFTVKNLPYSEYIQALESSHILLDQVYAYDQGFNALEAMAKGKVVFTGAEKEWLEYHNLKEDSIAINALPDANSIAGKLKWLVDNPEKIIEISKNARKYVEENHDSLIAAKNYLEKWQSKMES